MYCIFCQNLNFAKNSIVVFTIFLVSAQLSLLAYNVIMSNKNREIIAGNIFIFLFFQTFESILLLILSAISRELWG